MNSNSVQVIDQNKKAGEKENPRNYEVINFGRYMQDKYGKEFSSLSWRVLEKRGDLALLVTEKVIDVIQFSALDKNDWVTSDLRKWLNTEFTDCAFNDKEKAEICESPTGEKVFLLSIEDYEKYFTNSADARTVHTDYSKRKAYGHGNPSYAFWWLRTANPIGGWGEGGDVYVFHVCANGKINPFKRGQYEDGVRPAIWVKSKK